MGPEQVAAPMGLAVGQPPRASGAFGGCRARTIPRLILEGLEARGGARKGEFNVCATGVCVLGVRAQTLSSRKSDPLQLLGAFLLGSKHGVPGRSCR